MLRTALALAVALAATGCRVSVQSGPRGPAVCPGVTVTADDVRGDVNTTYLRAVVRKDGAPLADSHVDFRFPAGRQAYYSLFGTPDTDAQGVALADLGALVLVHAEPKEYVAKAKTMHAVYTGVLPSGDASCEVADEIAFEPSTRTIVPPVVEVADRAAFAQRLREASEALADDGSSVPRLRDGSSACRLLYGLATAAERRPELSEGGAAKTLYDAARHCTASPILASAQVSKLRPFEP